MFEIKILVSLKIVQIKSKIAVLTIIFIALQRKFEKIFQPLFFSLCSFIHHMSLQLDNNKRTIPFNMHYVEFKGFFYIHTATLNN